jgi:putative transposase
VSGLARTRLAKSVHDVGWSTLVRLLAEKATRYHRTVVKIGRWFPSSQLCSACGFNSGKKPSMSGPGPAWSVASPTIAT